MNMQANTSADAARAEADRPQPTQTFNRIIPYINCDRPAFDSAVIEAIGHYATVRGDERLWMICDLDSENFTVSCLEGVALLVIDVPSGDVRPIVDEGGLADAATAHRQRDKAVNALDAATDTPARKAVRRARRAMVI